MKSAQATITGVAPLLQNRFTDAARAEASDGIRRVHPTRTPADEDAASRLYADADGIPYIPETWVKRAMIGAAGFHKIGRRSATIAVAGAVFVSPDALTLGGAEWVTDTRAVVVNRGRIARHRPRFDEWEVSFTLEYDENIVDDRLLRLVLDDAGARIGIGDFRPATKGSYGRFVVTSWKAEK